MPHHTRRSAGAVSHFAYLFLYVFLTATSWQFLDLWADKLRRARAKREDGGNKTARAVCSLFMVLDTLLFLHILLSKGSVSRNGSSEWIVYCWINAPKYALFYFEEGVVGPAILTYSVANFAIIYSLLMFRSFTELFVGRKITIHTMLHTDMAWHCTTDFVDIVHMFSYAPSTNSTNFTQLEARLAEEGSAEVPIALMAGAVPTTISPFVGIPTSQAEALSVTAGVFIFLALFFHQQSFPGTPWREEEPTLLLQHQIDQQDQENREQKQQQAPYRPAAREMSATAHRRRSRHDGMNPQKEPHAHQQRQQNQQPQAYQHSTNLNVNVMRARKRSALVSILFVDLPFLILRAVRYYWSPEDLRSIETMTLKNLTCLILQAVALNSVQQVELQSSALLESLQEVADRGLAAASAGLEEVEDHDDAGSRRGPPAPGRHGHGLVGSDHQEGEIKSPARGRGGGPGPESCSGRDRATRWPTTCCWIKRWKRGILPFTKPAAAPKWAADPDVE
eukprot:g4629.t1